MDDALNLAKSGLLAYDTALSVTGYLSKEVEYIPWKASLTGKSSFFATQMFSYVVHVVYHLNKGIYYEEHTFYYFMYIVQIIHRLYLSIQFIFGIMNLRI